MLSGQALCFYPKVTASERNEAHLSEEGGVGARPAETAGVPLESHTISVYSAIFLRPSSPFLYFIFLFHSLPVLRWTCGYFLLQVISSLACFLALSLDLGA